MSCRGFPGARHSEIDETKGWARDFRVLRMGPNVGRFPQNVGRFFMPRFTPRISASFSNPTSPLNSMQSACTAPVHHEVQCHAVPSRSRAMFAPDTTADSAACETMRYLARQRSFCTPVTVCAIVATHRRRIQTSPRLPCGSSSVGAWRRLSITCHPWLRPGQPVRPQLRACLQLPPHTKHARTLQSVVEQSHVVRPDARGPGERACAWGHVRREKNAPHRA